jgi:glutamate synthase (NADPH/NADH) small chain
VEGREFEGVHFAMDFLTAQNKVNAGQLAAADNPISAEGRKVLVIGGGDTGSDCVGTSIRQKAISVTQIEIMPKPPETRRADNPWPWFAKTLKTSTSQKEGCERYWSLSTLRFVGDGRITRGAEVEEVIWELSDGKYVMRPLPGTRRIIETDLVLLALGFEHPVLDGLLNELGTELDNRKNIKVNNSLSTSVPKVFAAGDSVCGASLVVNAIASGRKVAKEIDTYLRRI